MQSPMIQPIMIASLLRRVLIMDRRLLIPGMVSNKSVRGKFIGTAAIIAHSGPQPYESEYPPGSFVVVKSLLESHTLG